MRRYALRTILAVLLCAGAPAHADKFDGATQWQNRAKNLARLVVDKIGGQHYLLFELNMPPGWHSYWRYPGASGIAPRFEFVQQNNVTLGAPIFPAPYFFDDGVGGFNGYENNAGVIFPLAIKNRTRPINLRLVAALGVCREICVPVDFDLKLRAPAAALASARYGETIRTYLDQRPDKPSDALRIASASFDGDALQFIITGEKLSAPRLMIIPNPENVIGEQRILGRSPQGFLIEFPAWSGLGKPFHGQVLEILLRDKQRAVLQKIPILAHSKTTQPSNERKPSHD